MAKNTDYSLFNNSRFYVLTASIFISLLVIGNLRIAIPNDHLYIIRLQQVFGLLSILYWYVALIVSPLGYVVGKQRTKHLEFARRSIGVSAFFYALLHAIISVWGQLGGPMQLQHLPTHFQWSLIGGGAALGILTLMAATSFDKVVKFMTFRKWKWLHRFIYAAFILVIVHIWSIGTHLAYSGIQLTAFAMLVVLSGLEMFRLVKSLSDKYLHLSRTESITLFLAVWTCVIALIISIPAIVANYHSGHTSHDSNVHGREVK